MRVPNIFSLIKIILYKIIRKFFCLPYNYSPLENFYFYVGKKPNKIALLSYRVLHVRELSHQTWSSGGDVFDLLAVLSKLGYKTDIIDCADYSFVPQKKYDLFIGNEGADFETIMPRLPSDATTIFYPATAYWKYNNQQQRERLEDLERRRNFSAKDERDLAPLGQEYALTHADGTIVLSNEVGKKTYPNFKQAYALEGASYVHKKIIDVNKKDFNAGKNNFLFLSGSGNAHKGLDLLLEAFAQIPQAHLYICTKLELDFSVAYKKELFDTPNIHYVGHIKLYRKKFYDLIASCNYVIFPSCSEGSPGSVADCMIQGLIPLVTRSAHLEVQGLGYYIDPPSVSSIVQLIHELMDHDERWYREKSRSIQNVASKRFDPAVFRKKMEQFIVCLTTEKAQKIKK